MTKPCLVIEMPDGEVKEVIAEKEYEDDWYTNKDILRWIAENIDFGVDSTTIIIRRDGVKNKVSVYSTETKEEFERFRKIGLDSLIDEYTLFNLVAPDVFK